MSEHKIAYYIYRPYITIKGRRVYPKNSKVFKIPVFEDQRKDSAETES